MSFCPSPVRTADSPDSQDDFDKLMEQKIKDSQGYKIDHFEVPIVDMSHGSLTEVVVKSSDIDDDVTDYIDNAIMSYKPRPKRRSSTKKGAISTRSAKNRNSKSASSENTNGQKTTKDVLIEWNKRYSKSTYGIWVLCCNKSCNKWRLTKAYEESYQVPDKWYCCMNDDVNRNSCSAPEDVQQNDFYSPFEFQPGSIVWARMIGYPRWPAMVEDDPDEEEFCEITLDSNGRKDVSYHVTFLDTKVSRHWVSSKNITRFDFKDKLPIIKGKNRGFVPALKEAYDVAMEAMELTLGERLKKYSFSKRFTGKFPAAKENETILDEETIVGEETATEEETTTEEETDSDDSDDDALSETLYVTSNLMKEIDDLDSCQSSEDETVKDVEEVINRDYDTIHASLQKSDVQANKQKRKPRNGKKPVASSINEQTTEPEEQLTGSEEISPKLDKPSVGDSKVKKVAKFSVKRKRNEENVSLKKQKISSPKSKYLMERQGIVNGLRTKVAKKMVLKAFEKTALITAKAIKEKKDLNSFKENNPDFYEKRFPKVETNIEKSEEEKQETEMLPEVVEELETNTELQNGVNGVLFKSQSESSTLSIDVSMEENQNSEKQKSLEKDSECENGEKDSEGEKGEKDSEDGKGEKDPESGKGEKDLEGGKGEKVSECLKEKKFLKVGVENKNLKGEEKKALKVERKKALKDEGKKDSEVVEGKKEKKVKKDLDGKKNFTAAVKKTKNPDELKTKKKTVAVEVNNPPKVKTCLFDEKDSLDNDDVVLVPDSLLYIEKPTKKENPHGLLRMNHPTKETHGPSPSQKIKEDGPFEIESKPEENDQTDNKPSQHQSNGVKGGDDEMTDTETVLKSAEPNPQQNDSVKKIVKPKRKRAIRAQNNGGLGHENELPVGTSNTGKQGDTSHTVKSKPKKLKIPKGIAKNDVVKVSMDVGLKEFHESGKIPGKQFKKVVDIPRKNKAFKPPVMKSAAKVKEDLKEPVPSKKDVQHVIDNFAEEPVPRKMGVQHVINDFDVMEKGMSSEASMKEAKEPELFALRSLGLSYSDSDGSDAFDFN